MGYQHSVGTFTLLVECRDPSYDGSDSGSDSECESSSYLGFIDGSWSSYEDWFGLGG